MRIILTVLMITATLAASANAATLQLVLSGTALDGPPAYSLKRGDTVIAEGTVGSALDSSVGLTKAEALAQTGETISIDIGQAADGGNLELRLTNDKWAGEGVPGDRNLFVLSASIDGQPISLADVTFISAGKTLTDPLSDNGVLVLARTHDVAIFPSAAPAAPPVALSAEPKVEATPEPKTAPEPEAAPEPAPVAEATPPAAPQAPVCAAQGEEIVADGFAINSWTVPERVVAPLRALAERTDLGGCSIAVTGYASFSGPAAWNGRLADMRAQAIAKVLVDAGLDIAVTTIAVGETDQFGEKPSANQRVVVSVSFQ